VRRSDFLVIGNGQHLKKQQFVMKDGQLEFRFIEFS
jgi:hypothetical protein